MRETNGQPSEKRGLFTRLKQRLAKTKDNIFGRIKRVIGLSGKVDDALIEQIEEILIQGDVGVETATKIVEQLRQREDARKAETPDQVLAVLKDILRNIVEHHERKLQVGPERPYVILVVGVNGTGKTTTIAKMARRFLDQGLSPMLVAGDTFRAAAIEQLEIWAKRTSTEIIRQKSGADPSAVVFDALQSANARKFDYVIIDTAGRLHTKENLMAELEKMRRTAARVVPGAPHEVLLVLDATTGQNGLEQARRFTASSGVTGIVLAKLDGTAKGGIVVAIARELNLPIRYVGVGEKAGDLLPFDPENYVASLFD